MQRIALCAVFLVLTQAAWADSHDADRPECPNTHYPCGTDSCCSR